MMRELMQFVRIVVQKVAGMLELGLTSEADSLLNSTAEKGLGMNLEDLFLLSDSDLIALTERDDWQVEKVQIAADLLIAQGKLERKLGNEKRARLHFRKALMLLNHLIKTSPTFSLEWEASLDRCKTLLK